MISINSKDLAYISIRVLSIYFFIQALLILSELINISVYNYMIFPNLGEENNISTLNLLFGTMAPFVILLAISIILWIFTDRISNYLLPSNNDVRDGVESKTNIDEIQYIAFSIIGVFILANTLPQTFNLIPSILMLNDISFQLINTTYKIEIIFSFSVYVVKLLIGLGLIFGSKGLTGILKRIREFGR